MSEATEHKPLVDRLNEDLELEFQSIVQYTQHLAVVTGTEYTSVLDELKVHLGQELSHATALAEQVAFLGGTPSTRVPAVPGVTDPDSALRADLSLEERQLDRYRERVAEANDAGLPDVAEALRPLLTQTQEHVRDLRAALGD
jgi:bacterioferritin